VAWATLKRRHFQGAASVVIELATSARPWTDIDDLMLNALEGAGVRSLCALRAGRNGGFTETASRGQGPHPYRVKARFQGAVMYFLRLKRQCKVHSLWPIMAMAEEEGAAGAV
jgi:hypothetical protein